MKKRFAALLLVLALLLTGLAGCGQDNGGSSKSSDKDDDDEEAEQLLGKGYYAAYDEDGDLAAYLYVTSSKITAYDKRGREDVKLGYDYSAKKDRYTLDDELFGSDEFTMKKSKKKLTLITGDDEEYTLEEIEKGDIPDPDRAPKPERTEKPVISDNPVISDDPGTPDDSELETYYLGSNGPVDLYAWLPDALLYDLETDSSDDFLSAIATSYDYDSGAEIAFYAVLSSGDKLRNAVDQAKSDYGDVYGSDADLMFRYTRDLILVDSLENGYMLDIYLDEDLEYNLMEEYIDLNGREWRCCSAHVSGPGFMGYIAFNFWMDDDNAAIVFTAGATESEDDYSVLAMYLTVLQMMQSLTLYT